MAADLRTSDHHVIVALDSSNHHHGIALVPPPSNDPRDPLRWPRWFKIVALVATAMCNFTGNFAGAGFSVAIVVLEMQFRKSASDVNTLLTFNFLTLGLGNLFWVPFGVKYGKRASLIVSMAMLFAVLCWTAKASTFNSLLAARCLSGFAASAGESIVPGIVNDLFFLHERASMMSIYIIFTTSATALGPLIAGYMVQYSKGSWRDYVWLCAALAGFNLLLLIFLYPESNFNRPSIPHPDTLTEDTETPYTSGEIKGNMKGDTAHLGFVEPGNDQHDTPIGVQHVDHIPVSWSRTCLSFFTVDHHVSLLTVAVRPLVVLIHPAVVWAVFVYGTSLAAQVILIFNLPSFLTPPPYSFSSSAIGLMQVAALIGFFFGMIAGGYLGDIITVKQILRAGGHSFPEQRLMALIPGFVIAPAGCILIAFACSEKLHWVSIAFGFGMVSFGTVYAPNIALTYVIERHQDIAAESLVLINAFKNLVTFLFTYVAVSWIASQGWVQVYMIMFMLVTLATLGAIPSYFWGEEMAARIEATQLHQRYLTNQRK
ncbi:MFS general substrate transporter [Aureobasidium subglaciale]|nr:MFS general substrate transporter [Aureobasidium subglaciale]